jgi:hypothetical protein
LSIWIFFWANGEINTISTLLAFESGNNEETELMKFNLLWFIVWTIGGGIAIYSLFLEVAGKEIIRIKDFELEIITKTPFSIKTRRFPIADISDLRVSISESLNVHSKLDVSLGNNGSIAFLYDNKTYRFGDELDEDEANYLLAEMIKVNSRLVDSVILS